MIDKFSTVYAGHVDLGDMGQQATPANERRYSNEHLASVFAKTEAIARCMDEHGYRTLWLAEHHFQHEGYECLPNILMVGVHLAHLTTRLRTGLRLQHRADVASAPARGGLRHRGHPDGRTRRLRRGPRLSHAARSRRSAPRCSTPRRTATCSRSRSTSS